MAATAVFARMLDFRRLDQLAAVDSWVHRLDARAKVIATLAFIVCVMSFGRYEVSRLLPYFAFPIVLIIVARVPVRVVLQKALLVLPVALLIGLPNPLFDREPLLRIGGMDISGGWISMGSIMLRALLAAIASIVLVGVTGFPVICSALERLGMPRPLAVQLLFLYRYLGVLGEEAMRMDYAHDLRSNGHSLSIREYGTLVGRLLLRTWDRAERIYLAMCARGFTGDFRSGTTTRFGLRELMFVVGWVALFLLLRTQDVSQWLGTAVLES